MKKSNDWCLFPNLTTLATYEPLSQVIELNTINRESILNIADYKDTYAAGKSFAIIEHECTHFKDHFGTLWGLKNLLCIYQALESVELNQEKYFSRIIKLTRELDKSKFPNYYNVVNKDVPLTGQSDWHYRLSAGFRFDYNGHTDRHSPILFSRFHTPSDVLICRTAFSVESLLETNAMCSELIIYIASQISNVCLNMPESLFKYVKIPNSFKPFTTATNKLFLTNEDRGYVFACIVQNILDNELKIDFSNTKSIDIDLILSNSGLPGVDKILEAAHFEINKLKNNLVVPVLKSRMEYNFDIGRKIFNMRHACNPEDFGFLEMIQNGINLPLVFKDDTEDKNELMNWYYYICELSDKMSEFKKACGY